MAVENIIESWKEVRSGLIDEAAQIPADQFSFQAAAGTRSVARILQHLIECQKCLIGEACRPDTNLLQPIADQIKHYALGISEVNDKDGLLNLLRASMNDAETQLLAAGDELRNTMKNVDARKCPSSLFFRLLSRTRCIIADSLPCTSGCSASSRL